MNNCNSEEKRMRLIKSKPEKKLISKAPNKYYEFLEPLPPLTTVAPPARYITHIKLHKNKNVKVKTNLSPEIQLPLPF